MSKPESQTQPLGVPSTGANIPVDSLLYRPRSYFGMFDEQTALLTHVKGRARRRVIKEAVESGNLAAVPSYLKATELHQEDRQAMGRIHPMFMGGEYLPRLKPTEVEIARISIKSTTFDVTTVYAVRGASRIYYRVCDEYNGDTLTGRTERSSIRPLTMGQLADFFLGAWDLINVLEGNYVDGGFDCYDEMLDFFDGESEFYPCFDRTLREMVRQRFPRPVEVGEDDS
jgi:hypothetical protein